MRRVFLDTSAAYALLDRRDRAHGAAARAFARLAPAECELVSSSYVLLETTTLLQARLGLDAVRQWRSAFQPLLEIVWVDEELHERAMHLLVSSAARAISLTDWTSFEIMRQRDLSEAFAFDRHFVEQGFTTLD